jgi:hypothetical protein
MRSARCACVKQLVFDVQQVSAPRHLSRSWANNVELFCGTACRAAKRVRGFLFPIEVVESAEVDKGSLLTELRPLEYGTPDQDEIPIDGQSVAACTAVASGSNLHRRLKQIMRDSILVRTYAQTQTPQHIIINKMPADRGKHGSAFAWHTDGQVGGTVLLVVLTVYEGR